MPTFRLPSDDPDPIYFEDTNGQRYKARYSHEFSLEQHADLVQKFIAMRTIWSRKPLDEVRLDHHVNTIVQDLVPGITTERISRISFFYRLKFIMWWMQQQIDLAGMEDDE